MKESAKTVAEAYARRIWEDRDLKAIDDLVDPKVVIHSILGDFHGPESMKKVVQAWLVGFPDLKVENTAIITEGDRVVMQWEARGTHQGDFKGIKPTGRAVSYAGVTVYRILHGKICEYWAYLDMQYLMQQIG